MTPLLEVFSQTHKGYPLKKKNASWNHSGLILTQAGNKSCSSPVSHQPRSADKGDVLYLFIFAAEPPGKPYITLLSWQGYGYRDHVSTCSGSRRSRRGEHQRGPRAGEDSVSWLHQSPYPAGDSVLQFCQFYPSCLWLTQQKNKLSHCNSLQLHAILQR